MKANLDRTVFIELLEKLAAEDDGEALAVAREIHALITVAGVSWNDLLVPEGGGGSAAGDQDEDDDDDDDDDEYEDDAVEDQDDEDDVDDADQTGGEDKDADADDDEDEEDDAGSEGGDDGDDDDDEDEDGKSGADRAEGGGHGLSDGDRQEALGLIDKVSALKVSRQTMEDLKDFKTDIDEGEFLAADLSYLRALHKRLADNA